MWVFFLHSVLTAHSRLNETELELENLGSPILRTDHSVIALKGKICLCVHYSCEYRCSYLDPVPLLYLQPFFMLHRSLPAAEPRAFLYLPPSCRLPSVFPSRGEEVTRSWPHVADQPPPDTPPALGLVKLHRNDVSAVLIVCDNVKVDDKHAYNRNNKAAPPGREESWTQLLFGSAREMRVMFPRV